MVYLSGQLKIQVIVISIAYILYMHFINEKTKNKQKVGYIDPLTGKFARF